MSLIPSSITTGSLESWEYFASYSDLRGWALLDGVLNAADSTNAAWHYNTHADAEHRSIVFDAWEYLASNVDLINWLGADGITDADALTAAKHYITNGAAEGRTMGTFDSAAYLAANADLQHWIIDILHLSGDAANDFAAQHYITFGRFEAGRPDGSNHAPVALNVVASGLEDAASITVNPSSTDVDAHDTATYSVTTQPLHGTVSVVGSSFAYVYTPNANYNGADSFTYQVTDAAGASSVATASITVTAVNDAPVAGTFTGSGLEDHAIIGQVSGTDIEGSTLTYSIVTNGAHGAVSLDAKTGAYTYTPNANYNGTDTFTYKANDGTVDSASETVTLTVTSVNDAPLFASATQTISIPESTTTATIVTAAATDVDLVDATPDSLTYTLTGADSAKFAIDSTTGAVTLAAPLNFEAPSSAAGTNTYSFTIVATDSHSVAATQAVTLNVTNVNEGSASAITDNNAAANTVFENAAVGAIVGVTALATDVDAPGDTITYSLTDNAGGRFAINSTTGVVTVAAALDYETNSTHDITVRALSSDTSFSNNVFTIAVGDVAEPVSRVLTVGTDNIPLTGSGNDTFDGRTNDNSLNVDDSIRAGDGIDTITADYTIAGTYRPGLIEGVENIDVTNTAPGIPGLVILDLLNTDTALLHLRATQSTNNLRFDNVKTNAEVQAVFTTADDSIAVNYTTAALAGATNVQVNLDNVAGTIFTIANAAANIGAAEQITVTSSIGAANLATINNTTNGGADYTLNIAGTAGVNLEAGANATVVNAAAASTGAVTYHSTTGIYTYAGSQGTDTLNVDSQTVTGITNTEVINSKGASVITVAFGDVTNVTVNDDATANNDVITLQDGNDTVFLGAGTDSLNVGEGANRVVISQVNLTGGVAGVRDTITGGTGSDTLSITAGAVADAQFSGVSNFEILELQTTAGVTIDTLALAAGIRTINGANETAPGLNNAGNAIVLEEQEANFALTITGGAGTVDTLTVMDAVDNGVASAGSDAGIYTLTVGGVETINLNGTAGLTGGVNLTISDAGNSTITGSNLADTITGGAGSEDYTTTGGNDTVNLGLGIDTLRVSAGGFTVSASGIDFAQVGAVATLNITDDTAGAITLTGAATVNAGTGADTITGSGGADNINAGAGVDVINMGGNLTAADTINGGTDLVNDTLVVANLGQVDADFARVSNINILQLATTVAAGSTVTLGTNALTTAGITTIIGTSQVGAGAGSNDTINIVAQAGALTLSVDGGENWTNIPANNNDTDTLNVNAGGAGVVTINATNVEQINLNTATTLNVSGTQGALIAGSAGVDIITGGDGNDTINAGAGFDSVNAGGGDDIVNATFSQFTDFTTAETLGGGAGTGDRLNLTEIAQYTAPTNHAVGDLVLGHVTGFETIGLTVADTVPVAGQTEYSDIDFIQLLNGQSLTISGRTVSAVGGIATAADVMLAFQDGAAHGFAVSAGGSGASVGAFTASAIDANTLRFTSNTPTTAVTDIVVTPSAATGDLDPSAVVDQQGRTLVADITAVTESAVVDFTGTGILAAGQSVTIDGRTVTAITGLGTPAQLAAVFVSGVPTGHFGVAGGLTAFTAALGGGDGGDTVTFTSATPSTNVTDLVVAASLGVTAPTKVVTDGRAFVPGTTAANEITTVTFQALELGESVMVAGVTVTATTRALTAIEVAESFDSAADGAAPVTFSAGVATVTGTLAGWSTADNAGTATVQFTATAASSASDITTPAAGFNATIVAALAAPVVATTQGVDNVLTADDIAVVNISDATFNANENAGAMTVDLRAAYRDAGDRVTLNAGGLTAGNNLTVILNDDVTGVAVTHNDSITSGAGDDTFIVNAGAAVLTALDTIVAGTGIDTIHLNNLSAGITAVVEFDSVSGVEAIVVDSEAAGNNVNLTLQDGVGAQVAPANLNVSVVTDANNATNATLTLIAGGIGTNLTVDGSANNDNIITGSGNDIIHGGAGADNIFAGNGVNVIDGGAGNDNLTGGSGFDTFALAGGGSDTVNLTTTLALNGNDTVTGFSFGTIGGVNAGDILDFAGIIVAVQNGNTGAVDTFRAFDQAGGADINITDAVGSVEVYAVVNGTGTLDLASVKALSANTALLNEILVGDVADAIVLVAGSNASTDYNIYHITDTLAGLGVVVDVQLIGHVTSTAFDGLIAANIA